MKTVEEIKRHVNKPEQHFTCRLLHQGANHLILGYWSSSEGKIGDIAIRAGSVTIAHYREGKGYVLWRMFDSAGRAIGSLFHICRDISIHQDRISYLDLLVDVWVSPDGRLRILDEDELLTAQKHGLLTAHDVDYIKRWRDTVIAEHETIIEQAIHEEKQAGISPEIP